MANGVSPCKTTNFKIEITTLTLTLAIQFCCVLHSQMTPTRFLCISLGALISLDLSQLSALIQD